MKRPSHSEAKSAQFASLLLFLSVLLMVLPSRATDTVDGGFNPSIRGPGTVKSLAWNPEGFAYAAVSGDKINGQAITTSLIRLSRTTGWDSSYQPVINGAASLVHQLADGKLIVAGSFTSIDGHVTQNIARLNADGSVDEGFTVISSSLPGSVLCLGSDLSGRLLVGMSVTPQAEFVNGVFTFPPSLAIVRLNSNGSKDVTFAPTFQGPTESLYTYNPVRINAIATQSNGKILVGGNFAKVNGVSQAFLARLDSSGQLDASYSPVFTFGSDFSYYLFGSSTEIQTIQIIANDESLIGGAFTGVNGYAQNAIARVTSTGDLDLSFRVFFSSSYSFSSAAAVYYARQDAAGRIILVGSYDGIDGNSQRYAVRVDQYGRLDPSFSTTFGNSDKFVILPDDYVIFGRSGSLSSNYVIQSQVTGYFVNGTKDSGLNLDIRTPARPDFMEVRPNSGPIVGGTWILEVNGHDTPGLMALTGSGGTDYGFNVALTPPASARSLLKVPGGYLIGGGFSQCHGVARPRLALCNEDGSLNTGFDLGSGPDGAVDLLRILPSGKVLIGGSFSKINGIAAKSVALLDLSKVGKAATLEVSSIIEARYGTASSYTDVTAQLQSMITNGSLSVVASNSAMGGDPASGQSKTLNVRYMTNQGERTASVSEGSTLVLPNRPWDSGLVDTSFRPNNTESLSLKDAFGDDDGRVVLVGGFSSFAGNDIPRMVRLNRDGSLDTAFTPYTDFSSFYPDICRPDFTGKILIGGSSLRHNGGLSNYGVHRLLPSGRRDSGFICPDFISSVEDILPLLDGRVFVAGSFSSSTSGERKRIARLYPSGYVDHLFDAGESADSTVDHLGLVTPNKLFVLGAFSSFQGLAKKGLCLIALQEALPSQARLIPLGDGKEGDSLSYWVSPQGEGEVIQWTKDGSPTSSSNYTFTIPTLSMSDAGAYQVRISNSVGFTLAGAVLRVSEMTFQEWAKSLSLSGNQATDTDGDRQSDYGEYLARTDPRDSSSRFSSTLSISSGNVRMAWKTFPGRRYTVSESSNCVNWTTSIGQVIGDGMDYEYLAPLDDIGRSGFFRVSVEK